MKKWLLIRVTQRNNGGIYLSIVGKQKKRGYLTLNLVVDVVMSSLKQQRCQCYEDLLKMFSDHQQLEVWSCIEGNG